MEKVVLIVSDFVKELLVCCSTEFLEGWEVWLTESTFLVAAQERVDSLLVTLISKS